MKTITSLSGGKTSSYLAANYPSDAIVFSLVRIEDNRCRFKDEKIRKLVEDKIQAPFIATAEDDTIIYTILDLEQYLGRKIDWVTGITFDEVINKKGGWLPNKLHRYCTTWLKIDPIFHYWRKNFNEPVYMNIGFRANETNRAIKMLNRRNENGFVEYKGIIGKHKNGNNKWKSIEYQVPNFPLIQNHIYRDTIHNFWIDKPVRFAERNNCVGCFHRTPVLLKYQFEKHPKKMNWFLEQEQEQHKRKKNKKATWRSDVDYEKIRNSNLQIDLISEMFSECDSGYCEPF